MLKCLECGAELKRISNTHLLKCSKITMAEYSIKHGIPLYNLVLQSCINQGAQTRILLSNEEKNKAKEKCHETLKKKQTEPNEEELQILIGSLLGDGYIHNAKNYPFSSYFCVQHGIKQLDYLLWKGLKLKRLETKFFQYYHHSSVANRYVTSNEIRTKSSYYLGELSKIFYTKDVGHKRITNFNFIKKINPLGLAVWYMDDGSNTDLCTNGFLSEEVDKLIEILNVNFKLFPKKHLITNEQFVIRFPMKELKKLFSIIKPFVIPSMMYKIENIEKNSKRPKISVSKRIVFDSAHFLEDHPAKCYNLHGGRYTLDVLLKGEINPETGMLMDYTYLKKIVSQYIVDVFDHHSINDQIKELKWRSTTELISIWIWFTLIEFLPGLSKITLWETTDSWCEYEGPSYKEIKKFKGNHPHLQFLKEINDINFKFRKNRIIGKVEDIFNEEIFDGTIVNGVSFDFIKTKGRQ